MRIAVLGWGSLLWEEDSEFDKWHDEWRNDGPVLPIEFSRVSKKRANALTLVIDPRHGSQIAVQWCLSKRKKWEDAKCDLRCREDTTLEKIGAMDVKNSDSKKIDAIIAKWAKRQDLDFVVWTALKSNFEEKAKKPFSVHEAVAWVQSLSPDGKSMAAEYIWRARDFVQTPVRLALKKEPWLPKPD